MHQLCDPEAGVVPVAATFELIQAAGGGVAGAIRRRPRSIGGDFDAKPKDVQAMVARQVSGRANRSTSLDAKPAPQVTHPHTGGTLDHFVVIGNGAETVATVAVNNVQASDHDSVVMEMQIQRPRRSRGAV